MRNIATKQDNVGDVLPADAFNSNQNELENFVTDSNQSLNPDAGPDTDLNMMGKSARLYGSAGSTFTDGGTANTYVLTSPTGNSLQTVPSLKDGIKVNFTAANSNTGASTINLSGLGAKTIKTFDGNDIIEGDIISGRIVSAIYRSATDTFELDEANCGPAFELFSSRILNGGMRFNQRYGSSIQTMNTNGEPSLDMWSCDFTGVTGVVDHSRATTPLPTDPSNPSHVLKVKTSVSQATIAAGEYRTSANLIEGYYMRDLEGYTGILSFWFRSNTAGDFGVYLQNDGKDRSFVTKLTSVADVWQKFSIIVPMNWSGGTWDLEDGTGFRFGICEAAGTTYQTATLGQWISGNYVAPNTQVNFLSSTSNEYYLTNVELKKGRIETPFRFVPYGVELTQLQRYVEKSYDLGIVPGTADFGGAISNQIQTTSSIQHQIAWGFKTPKRTDTPTVTIYSSNSGASGNVYFNAASDNAASVSAIYLNRNQMLVSLNAGAVGTVGNRTECQYLVEDDLS